MAGIIFGRLCKGLERRKARSRQVRGFCVRSCQPGALVDRQVEQAGSTFGGPVYTHVRRATSVRRLAAAYNAAMGRLAPFCTRISRG